MCPNTIWKIKNIIIRLLKVKLQKIQTYNPYEIWDSKWSTKFHKDCMFEILEISLLRRLMINFLVFKKVLGPMFHTELLQHSKLNSTV